MRTSAVRRVCAMMSGLAVVAASVLVAGGAASAATSGGVKTPAIGARPHYVVAGRAEDDPQGQTFGCQQSTPAQCYGPKQMRAAYGVDSLADHFRLDGAGRTIVIVDAYSSPTLRHDLATFDQIFGLPDPKLDVVAPDGRTPFDPEDANQVGWAGEITLDVEWAHAIAPKATIKLVLAKTNHDADILSATKYAVTHELGDVISQSFGEAEQCMDPKLVQRQHELFRQATKRHITLLASAGDQGSAQPTCDGASYFKATSTPASDPNVTSVGGTRLYADGITGEYHGEKVWNEPEYTSAGGGGYSVLYDAPRYQRRLGTSARAVPDVAYNGSIIGGVLTVWSSSGKGEDLVFRFGGTSAGSPQWAGLVALADQLGHHRVGAVNDDLYRWARGPLQRAFFHDVTSGDNTFHGTDVTVPGYPAGPGWDAATGLGSPNADRLVPLLATSR